MKNRISEHSMNGVYTCTFRPHPKGSIEILGVKYKPLNWERPEKYSRGLVVKMFNEAVEAGRTFFGENGYLPGRIDSEAREENGLVRTVAT